MLQLDLTENLTAYIQDVYNWRIPTSITGAKAVELDHPLSVSHQKALRNSYGIFFSLLYRYLLTLVMGCDMYIVNVPHLTLTMDLCHFGENTNDSFSFYK